MAVFRIHGARGSYPVSGPRYRKYGGHTSSFSVETNRGVIIIDAGTGITTIGEELARRSRIPPIALLFTHLHLDHSLGLCSFKPFYSSKARVTLLADPVVSVDWRATVRMMTRRCGCGPTAIRWCW